MQVGVQQGYSVRQHIVPIVGTTILAVILLGAHAWLLSVNFAAMVEQLEAAETVVESGTAAIRNFPMRGNQSPTAVEAQDNRRRWADMYEGFRVDLQTSAGRMRRVVLLPWWFDVKAARRAMLDHIGAWDSRFATVGQDPTNLANVSSDIQSTFQLACEALAGAVPMVDLHGSGERVDAICAD